ncbi:hypothetical protein [Sodalis sp.]
MLTPAASRWRQHKRKHDMVHLPSWLLPYGKAIAPGVKGSVCHW